MSPILTLHTFNKYPSMAKEKTNSQNIQKKHRVIVSKKGKYSKEQAHPVQWNIQGDFFTKFSLYSERSSGLTSANTIFGNNQ